jgi:hypothetical protein
MTLTVWTREDGDKCAGFFARFVPGGERDARLFSRRDVLLHVPMHQAASRIKSGTCRSTVPPRKARSSRVSEPLLLLATGRFEVADCTNQIPMKSSKAAIMVVQLPQPAS